MSAMNLFTAVGRTPAREAAIREAPVRETTAREVPVRDAAARTSAARTPRTARADSVRDREDVTTEGNERTERRGAKPAEFSALLAILAGQSEQAVARANPQGDATLVDRLLDDAGALDESLLPEDAPGIQGLTQALASRASATPSADRALQHGVLDPTADTQATVVDLAAYAREREARLSGQQGLGGLVRAASNASQHGDEHALDILNRVATRRGSSVEQLLALGDAKGADLRAALDTLLSQAGTPEALDLANGGYGDRIAAVKQMARKLMASTAAFGDDTAAQTSGIASLNAGVANVHAHAHAHAAALAAATAASAADPATPVRELDAVSPELRGRVQRVIERMRNEYGHDVTIVETARSQERQDWLFEQGRTRGGPIVTWTRDSAHTRGEAVDVVVDGSWDNAEGFARLQRIAREEGLRTLGMKDPGHLELAKANGAPADLTARVERLQAQARAADQQTAAAQSAGVARVAGVAGVAGVAQVAGTASSANEGPTSATQSMGATGVAAYAAQQQSKADSNGNAFGRGERDEQGKPLNDGRKLGHAKRESADGPSAYGSLSGGTTNGSAIPSVTGAERAATVGNAAGSEQAQRVSDIQQMRADAPVGPLNRMTLNVEGAGGKQQTITVDLRGNTVSTSINTDAASAERLRMHTGELQDALARQGLESDTVRISATRKPESADAARLVNDGQDARVGGVQQSGAQDGASANGQRERSPAREWNQDEARREQSARSRDQREQQERQDRSRRPAFPFGTE